MQKTRKARRVREVVLYDNEFNSETEAWVRDDLIERRREDGDDSIPTDAEVFDEWCNFYDPTLWEDFECEIKDFLEDKLLVVSGSCGLWYGREDGGKVVTGWKELCTVLNNMDYIAFSDVGGKLEIQCSHHDGTNYWEVREVTEKGARWYYDHEDEDRRAVVETLFYDKGKSKNLNYVRHVYGPGSKAGKLVER